MTKLESLLLEARTLPPGEQARLAGLLLSHSGGEPEPERFVGQRGLAAWTASASAEDWSEFYPPDLLNGRSTPA